MDAKILEKLMKMSFREYCLIIIGVVSCYCFVTLLIVDGKKFIHWLKYRLVKSGLYIAIRSFLWG